MRTAQVAIQLAACVVVALGSSSSSSPLWNVSIAVPDVDESIAGVEFSLRDAACTHFAIRRVSSSTATRPQEANVSIDVEGVEAECDGTWKYEGENKLRLPRGEGTVKAKLSASLAATVSVVGGSLPEKTTLTACDATAALDLSISGDKSSKVPWDRISKKIAEALEAWVCSFAAPLIDKNVTRVVQESNAKLANCVVPPKTTTPPPFSPTDVIDWGGAGTTLASELGTCALRRALASKSFPLAVDFSVVQGVTARLRGNLTAENSSLLVSSSSSSAAIDAAIRLPGWTNGSFVLDVLIDDDDEDSSPASLSFFFDEFFDRGGRSSLAVDVASFNSTLRAGLVAAVSKSVLGGTTLGALNEDPLPCAARSVLDLNVTAIGFRAKDTFASSSTAGGKQNDRPWLGVATDAVSAVTRAFPGLVDACLECLLDGFLRERLDEELASFLRRQRERPCSPPKHPEGSLVRWNESKALLLLDGLVTADAVNFGFDCLAPARAADLGLDTWTQLTLLSGVADDLLESSGSLDRLTLRLDLPKRGVWTATLRGLTWDLLVALPLDAATFYDNTTLGDLFGQRRGGEKACPSLVAAPSIAGLKVDYGSSSWTVGPGYDGDAAALEEVLDEAVVAIFQLGDEYGDVLVDRLNDAVAAEVDAACFDSEESSSSSTKKGTKSALIKPKDWLLVVAIAFIVLVACTLLYVLGMALARGRAAWRDQGRDDEGHSPSSALLTQAERADAAAEGEAPPLFFGTTKKKDSDEEEPVALVLSAKVPLVARVSVPVLIVVNVAFFVWSNCTAAASVVVELELLKHAEGVGPLTYNLGSLFKFSLANSVRDMWRAGVYPLSVLIALCSGGWPYLKLVAMLACWVAPPSSSSSGKGKGEGSDDDDAGCVLGGPTFCLALRPEARERVLIWLDALGKWSLVDTFVMTLMTVAFHFDVVVGLDDEGGGDFKDAVVVKVFVEALPSIYVFVAATCLSLVLGHATLASHRRDATTTTARDEDFQKEARELRTFLRRGGPGDDRYSLAAHDFDEAVALTPGRRRRKHLPLDEEQKENAEEEQKDPYDEEGSSSSFSPSSLLSERKEDYDDDDDALDGRPQSAPTHHLGPEVRYGVVFGLAVALALLVWGATVPAFDFEIRGLAGWIMGADATETFSLVSLGSKVPKASKNPRNAGPLTLSAVYFAYALVVPLVTLPALLILWIAPLGLEAQRTLTKACEVLNAWSALDVFMIAILACVTEISQFAQFMVGHKCDGVDKVLRERFDAALHGDDKCFDVVTQLRYGIWLLFAAAALAGFLAQLVLRCAHTALDERQVRQRHHHQKATRLATTDDAEP